MSALTRRKITFAELPASSVSGLLIYCSDYKCSHWTAISGDMGPTGADGCITSHDILSLAQKLSLVVDEIVAG